MKKNLLVLLLLLVSGRGLYAYGPQAVTASGTVIKWPSASVTYYVESDLDVAGKSVTSLLSEAVAEWTSVTEASFTATQAALGAAIDNDNVCCYLYDELACPETSLLTDGVNPIVIDEDGSITKRFFGPGNQFATLGFAAIVSSDDSGNALKGEAVFNAACLNGVAQAGCGSTSFSDDDFTSFMVHELGHFLGLNHSQVNLTEGLSSTTSDDSLITTMYPFFTQGNGANFKTPERDDKVGLAVLYPASNFASTTGKVTGTVSASGAEFQCANVIVRNTDATKSRTDAISFVSGMLHPGAATDGDYEIQGLTDGQSYSVEVEPISTELIGASGIPPCDGGSNPSPSTKQFTAQVHGTTVTAAAGGTTSGIDFSVVVTSSNVSLPGIFDSTPHLALSGDTDPAILEDIQALELGSLELGKGVTSTCSAPGTVSSGGSSTSSGCSLIPTNQAPRR